MRLSEINIYPVKSLKGISLGESRVEGRGFSFDRRWMLVDGDDRFMTQRDFPQMARIETAIVDGRLEVCCEGSRLLVPEDPGDDVFEAAIWEGPVRSSRFGSEVNDWFSDVLGVKCSLVAMPADSRRRVEDGYAVHDDDVVSFADAYPFLLISEGSLEELNSRLVSPVPMNRFRPNLVVQGADAFAEDKWKKVRVGETVFHVVKPCARCVLTTVDQQTGIKDGKEPLKTLASFRTVNNKVLFGQNLIAENPGGVVRLGEAVEVLESAVN